ncbi:MAG: MFS transporter [Pseudomonadota bacterium]
MNALPFRLARRLPFFYGWVVVAVAFITLGFGNNIRAAFSLLYPPLLSEFGWDRAITGSIFSIGFFVAALLAPLMGWLMDRHGPQVVIAGATALVAAGLALATQADTLWQFQVTLGVMTIGGCSALAFNGHFIFLPHWFSRQRALAIGIVSAGSGLVGLIMFPWLQGMIEGVGWRQGCLIIAGLLVILVLPLNALLQRRAPADLGLRPDGDDDEGRAAARSGLRPPRIVDPAWAAKPWTLAEALCTLRFWACAIGFATAMFAWYGILVHQTKLLVDLGFEAELAAIILGLIPMLGVVGQIVLGILADRIWREWVWTISCFGFVLGCLALLALPYATDPLLVYAFAAAMGVLGYALPVVYGAIPADLFQGPHYGSIYGSLALIGSSGAAAGPFVYGALFDATRTYDGALWLTIAVAFASMAAMWIAAPRNVRRPG